MSYCTLCSRAFPDTSIKGGVCYECRGEQVQAMRNLEERGPEPPPLRTSDASGGIILTTALEIPDRKITGIVDVIAAEAAVGMNVFKDIANSWRDFVGGRSETTQTALKKARLDCMTELRKQAAERGADAVIAVDLDYNQITTSGGTGGLLLVVASGTAVTLASS